MRMTCFIFAICFCCLSCNPKDAMEIKSSGNGSGEKIRITSMAEFDEKMRSVEIGWTQDRVNSFLGLPKVNNDGSWCYSFIEDENLGGWRRTYYFIFNEGKVAEIKTVAGHGHGGKRRRE